MKKHRHWKGVRRGGRSRRAREIYEGGKETDGKSFSEGASQLGRVIHQQHVVNRIRQRFSYNLCSSTQQSFVSGIMEIPGTGCSAHLKKSAALRVTVYFTCAFGCGLTLAASAPGSGVNFLKTMIK